MEVEEGRDSEVYGAGVIYSTAVGGRNSLCRHLDQLRELLEEQNENQWEWAENINIGPEVMSDQGQEDIEQTEGESTKTVPEKPRAVEAHGNDNGDSEAEGEVMDEAGGKLEIQPMIYPSRVR